MSTPEDNAKAIAALEAQTAVLDAKADQHAEQCRQTNESNAKKFDKIFDMLDGMQKHIYMGIGILVALQFAAVVFIKFVD